MRKIVVIKMIGIGFFVLFLINSAVIGAQKGVVIKIATLAPEGSAWMQVFNELNAEVMAKTQKTVRFRIYPGGVLGDETDMLRKMQIGQIHGAALSAPGLSMIFREVDVFQVPFLFETYDEVDHLLIKMDAFLREGLEKNGYVLLGWSEAGFVRLMSTIPVTTLSGLKKLKVWTWADAPMAKTIFDEAQISAIPLSIPDVLLGLQTGLVEVVYAPPAGAISLQWFTRVKYIIDVPLIYLAGGIVIKKNVYEKIPRAARDMMMESIKNHLAKLKTVIRKQNREAIHVMEKHGVKILIPSGEEVEKWKRLSNKAMQRLGRKDLSKKVLDEALTYLEQYRKVKK